MADERDARTLDLAVLTAGMAHELRNVLAAADGSLFLASRGASPSADVEAARRQIHLAQELVSRALAAAAGRALHREPVDAAGLLDAAIAAARAGGARATTTAAPGLRLLVDPVLVGRALANLVDNAIGAARRAGVPPDLEASAEEGADRVILRIADRGPGLPPELRARLFEPFASGHAEGTGLGLALCRAVARLHGGELSVHDTEGGGATFVLSLPRAGGEREIGPEPA